MNVFFFIDTFHEKGSAVLVHFGMLSASIILIIEKITVIGKFRYKIKI